MAVPHLVVIFKSELLSDSIPEFTPSLREQLLLQFALPGVVGPRCLPVCTAPFSVRRKGSYREKTVDERPPALLMNEIGLDRNGYSSDRPLQYEM